MAWRRGVAYSQDLRDRVFALAAQAGVKVQQVYILPAGKGRMANAFAAEPSKVTLSPVSARRAEA